MWINKKISDNSCFLSIFTLLKKKAVIQKITQSTDY